MKADGFIIVWDNGEMTVPFGWADDCEGAVEAAGSTGLIAMFATMEEARKAIRISTAFNALLREQGKPFNEDFFMPQKKNIEIRQLGTAARVKNSAE